MGTQRKVGFVVAALGIAVALPAGAVAAPSTDTASSLAIAGDGSDDTVVVGTTSPDGSASDVGLARVNPNGTVDTSAGGGDGRVRHDFGRQETANDIVAGPGGSFTFTGNSTSGPSGGDVLVGRVDAGLGLDAGCGGDGAEVIDLGGTERGDLVAPSGSGFVVAGVRDGVAFVIRLNADCTFDATFGVHELDFGAEGDVVAVNDILVDPVTNEITLAVKLSTDAGVVQLESDGDPDLTFSGDGLLKVNLGTSADRFTGLVEMGGLLYVVGDNGTDGNTVRIDANGAVLSGPVAFDLGPGSDVVNGALMLGGGNLFTYGGIPGSGFYDSAAALVDANALTLVPGFAGDGNAAFDPGAGLNLLNDGAAVGGVAMASALVDNNGTQSFDFGLAAIGADGALAPGFNNGQFLLIDFEGQTGTGGADGGSTPPGTGPPPVADFSVEKIDLVESDFVEGLPVRPPAGAPALKGALGAGRYYWARVVVKNNGPDRAAVGRAALLSRDFPGGAFNQVSLLNTNTLGFDPNDLFLNPGESRELYLRLQYDEPGPREVRAEVFPTFAEDRNPANNEKDSGEIDVYSIADSRISKLPARIPQGHPDEIEGRTFKFAAEPVDLGTVMRLAPAAFSVRRERVTKVEVAIVRLEGGAKAVGRRPPVCQWLRNSRARFKRIRPRGGRCDRAVWLRAKGTTRWSFRLTRGLPKGSYVLYSRATNGAGISERSFTRRDGNRVAFRVRR